MKRIKVLVVEDSIFMRNVISDIIDSDPQLRVIGTARDGEEALNKLDELKPDVITLDIEMPRMDGLSVLKQIMKKNPKPVIMLSALTQEGAIHTFKALEYGAVDYIPKPSGNISLNLSTIKDEIISKIKMAASANLPKLKIKPVHIESYELTDKIVAIGALSLIHI